MIQNPGSVPVRPAPAGRASRCFAGLLLSLSVAGVWADVIPFIPGTWERFEKNKNLYDRADQFCQSKAVAAACEIPGTAFEGGGKGACERNLVPGTGKIDLRCVPATPAVIERRVPEGPFLSDPGECKDSAKLFPDQPLDCIDPPPVSDRFCVGRKENDGCTAVFRVASKESSEAGRCAMTVDKMSYYHYGRRFGTRRVLQCMPLRPAPASEFKNVPLATKLWPR